MLTAPPEKPQTLQNSQVIKVVAHRLLPAIDNFIQQLIVLRARLDQQAQETGHPPDMFPLQKGSQEKLMIRVVSCQLP